MSGKPYPEGVAEAIKLLDLIMKLDAEQVDLQHRIDSHTSRLKNVIDDRAGTWREYQKLMQSIDVVQGNTGFDQRALWFLAEMRRQT